MAAAALTLFSCSRLPIYSKYQHIGNDGWEKTDTLVFKIPVKQHGRYAVQLGMRADSFYPYTQLTVVVKQKTQENATERTDTLTLDITDTKGNINGKGFSIYQYNYSLPQAILDDNDCLTVTIYHGMRRNILPGIRDVGITVKSF